MTVTKKTKMIYILDIKPSHIGSLFFFLCNLCQSLGPDFVVAFTMEPTDILKQFFIAKGCQYIVVNKFSWDLIKICSKYNVVLTGFFQLSFFVRIMLRCLRVKYIFVNHASIFDEYLIENQTKTKLFFKILKSKLKALTLYKIICVSYFSFNQLYRAGIPKHKLKIIPNGVSTDLQQQYNVNDFNEEIRSTLNQNKDRIKCIFVGSLESFKGIDIILNTVNRFPHVDFYIAGEGSLKNKVIEATINNKNVFYFGLIQNYVLLANLFDFAIVPSRWNESFCYSALEAQYSNIHVIASRKGALPEVLNQENVVYMTSLDVKGLEEAITKTLSAIDQQQKTKISHTLSIEKQTVSYTNLLRSI